MYDTNITQNTGSLPPGRELLRELYKEAPPELYFEIRCIHPINGQVRSLWARMNDADGKKRIFAEAEHHNKEGYSLYFAPCLRREKRGNADSAAYISALWVDVDGKDERSLQKLNDFEQPPSVIVDSGGGYHAYWFLSDPLCLETDEQKQHIASIMIGLFSVTGGDEAYVKSVASVMRLPDSINTKPERDNAKVSIIAWHPERRYKLAEFEWLSKPKQETIDGMKVITLNGHGVLPPLHRLAQIMGHDSLDTTMIYVQATQHDLQQDVEDIAWE